MPNTAGAWQHGKERGTQGNMGRGRKDKSTVQHGGELLLLSFLSITFSDPREGYGMPFPAGRLLHQGLYWFMWLADHLHDLLPSAHDCGVCIRLHTEQTCVFARLPLLQTTG